MPEMYLHNTLTRRKEKFVPLDENNVRMYVCGPTVYDRAHLGNAKSAVVFDVLNRVLREVYGKDHVTYVSNITDIDDKILNKHQETGKPISEITRETYQWYLDDMHALNVADPIKKEGLQKLSSLLAAACKLCQEQPDFYQAQILSLIYELIYLLCTTFPASGKNAAPGKEYRHYDRLRTVTIAFRILHNCG